MEREFNLYTDKKKYTYVGVSPPIERKVRVYIRRGWNGKVFEELKPYRVEYMKPEKRERS
jgi:hypothetical protein